MINEIDLRDWDFDSLKSSLTFIRHSGAEHNQHDVNLCDEFLREFIDHIETLSKHGQRQVAALLQAKKDTP